MKIIVITDNDGHTWGVAHTPENVKKLKDAMIESGVDSDDLDRFSNGFMTGRVFGGVCEIIDTDHLEEFPNYNPFI